MRLDYKHHLLVTCCNQLGGLFRLNAYTGEYVKLLDEDCRGLAAYRSGIIVATNSSGIMILDHQGNVLQCNKLLEKDYHGIALNGNHALVVETAINAIGIYELPTLNRIGEYRMNPANSDILHINDLFIHENKMYVSMFSLEGSWRETQHLPSGGFVEYKLPQAIRQRVHYAQKVHQPHSVQMMNRQLLYCNSYQKEVKLESETVFRTYGYPRGLAFKDSWLYVGNSTRVPDQHNPCAGVYALSLKDKTSSFFPLPALEVYGIICC